MASALSITKNKPVMIAVAGLLGIVAVVVAAMNIFGGPQPGQPLPPDKKSAAAAPASTTTVPAPGTPTQPSTTVAQPIFNPNEVMPVPAGQTRQGAARMANPPK